MYIGIGTSSKQLKLHEIEFMNKDNVCIYCGKNTGMTQDHVPARCFFEKSCPNDAQRITVPCCETCRREDEKYDAFVRNIIAGLLETGSADYVEEHITDKVSRSIERVRWESKRLLEIMKVQYLITSTLLVSLR